MELSLDAFGSLWPAVVESLREETPMLAALLEDCAPASLAGDGLTLAWPESSAFLKRKAEDPANRELIAKAIRSVTGSSLRLAYELRAEGDPLPVAAVAATPKLSDEDLVQRFKDEFDAEEIASGTRGADLMPQPPNLQKMLAEAQAMLAAQQEAQEKLKEQKVEASSGGGMVKVAMTGDMRLESLTIDPDAVDPEDVEMLQDMVVAGDQRGAADGRGAPAEPARRRRAGWL